MRKFLGFFMIIALLAVITGCQNDSNMLEPQNSFNPPSAAFMEIPDGATVESATFYIYVLTPGNQPVNTHRVTADWDETTVTWNSFGEAFDPAIIGSFTTATAGWYTVDITDLFKSWLDGSVPNYGILLDQVEKEYPRTIYLAHENDYNQPFMEVCYTVNGEETCIEAVADQDAYIWELNPNQNNGTSIALYTGWAFETDMEKQSLVWFDITTTDIPDDSGCSLTIGYWKNHAGFGPQDDMVSALLPIWLGTPGGAKSMAVNSAAMAVDILKQKVYGKPNNGITKLYAQMLGAKLNDANGASIGDIADALADADAFLADHDYMDWGDLSDADKDMVMYWHDMFDDYNNGLIGPGHCDYDDYGDDD